TKLIRCTAMIKESHRLTIREQAALGYDGDNTYVSHRADAYKLSKPLDNSWSNDIAWVGHAFGSTEHALKIRPVWLREILEGTDPERRAREVIASAVIERVTPGAKTVELRSKPCPSDRIGCKISLMETGTKTIKGTAILAESRALTVEEQITFAGVLQAHRCVLQTHSTQTGSQALNYKANQTYAWVLQDVRAHPEPFEASVTTRTKECGQEYSHRCQRGRRVEP
ncbi:unnamed protein product, partial [Symbiodinium sp. CCMP2592]